MDRPRPARPDHQPSTINGERSEHVTSDPGSAPATEGRSAAFADEPDLADVQHGAAAANRSGDCGEPGAGAAGRVSVSEVRSAGPAVHGLPLLSRPVLRATERAGRAAVARVRPGAG